jgi:hypothetical protein
MFPAFLLPALLGGGLGLLTNKKDPMKGALLGAGLGAVGGHLMPGLLGGAAGTPINPAAAAMETGGFLGEGAASGIPAWDKAGSGLLDQVSKVGKPAMQVAQSGLLGGDEQPIQPSPIVQAPMTGNQTLAALAQQGSGYQDQLAMAEQERRKRRQGLLGGVA